MKNVYGLILTHSDETTVEDQALLLVEGFPLSFHVATSCQQSQVLEKTFLAFEHSEVGRMAEMLGLGRFDLTNLTKTEVISHFFDLHPQAEVLVVVSGAAPLVKAQTIKSFTKEFFSSQAEVMFSVEGDNSWNGTGEFSPGIRGRDAVLCAYRRTAAGNNGAKKIRTFTVNRFESIIAKDWESLFVLEACLAHRYRRESLGKHRFTPRVRQIDGNVRKVMRDDRVGVYTNEWVNIPKTNVKQAIERMGDGSWCYQLIYNAKDQIGLIQQMPQEGVRPHAHVTKDEWWMVLRGTFEWRLDGGEVIRAEEGEIVYLPAGTVHAIVCVSDMPGIRLACGARDFEHIYV